MLILNVLQNKNHSDHRYRFKFNQSNVFTVFTADRSKTSDISFIHFFFHSNYTQAFMKISWIPTPSQQSIIYNKLHKKNHQNSLRNVKLNVLNRSGWRLNK